GPGEPDETIIVTLSNPTGPNAVVEISQHTYTISDYLPDVAFDAATSSGSEGTTPAYIAVSLSHTSDLTMTVDYAVTGGDATGGGVDYTLANGTLTFDPYVTAQNISLDIVDDNDLEGNETVVLTLSNPTNGSLGSITEHTFTIVDNEPGLLWEDKIWYYSSTPGRLFINGDGDLEWFPEQGGQYVTRIPDQDLSQPGQKVELSWWYLSDGKDDCPPDSCYNCTYCDDVVTCIAGTSDFRFGLFQADGQYAENDGFSVSDDIWAGYRGYNWRFGPHLQAYPTRWVDCTGEVHKTGNFAKKPESRADLMKINDGLQDYIPGFELPLSEWSLLTLSLERLSSSSIEMLITLNDTTYTWTDNSSSEQPTMIDVFGIHMRNGRPYTRLVLSSLSGPDTTPPSPDPMTWATAPYATGSTSIAMTATTATDTSGVEYYFECTSGGGNDSGWQDSTSYTDTGLTPDTQYCYRVQARDKSTNQNATAWSTTDCATTTSQQPQTLVQVDFGPGNVVSGWTQWNATSGSKTVNGIDFTLANSGMVAGPKLRERTGGSSDDLTYDCISCEDPGSGTKTYTLTITNLANGDYNLLTYFNRLYDSTGCTQQVKVDSVLKAGPSNAPLQQDTANCLQLTAGFTVTGGTSQVITVEWIETDGNGMPYVSAFELIQISP
ncbi:MAG: Calx-beta domain-containing protein, partial [Planctomycetota bacterium]